MKHHLSIILLISLVALLSCNLQQEQQLSDPVNFTINLNSILGQPQESKASFSSLFSETTGKTPKMDLIIDGQLVTLNVTVTLHKDSDKSIIESISQTSDSVYVDFSFNPIVVGEEIYATLVITEEGKTESIFSSQTESITIKTGNNTLSIPLNPQLFLYQYIDRVDPSDDYAAPTKMNAYKTALPAKYESGAILDPNSSTPIDMIDFCLGENGESFILAFSTEKDSSDNFNLHNLYKVDKDGTSSLYATALIYETYHIIDFFYYEAAPIIFVADEHKLNYFFLTESGNYETVNFTPVTSIENVISSKSITSVHATSVNEKIYFFGMDSSFQKYLIPLEIFDNEETPGEDLNYVVNQDEVKTILDQTLSSLDSGVSDIIKANQNYAFEPIVYITDFVNFNEDLVFLVKITSGDIFRPLDLESYQSVGYIGVILSSYLASSDTSYYAQTYGLASNLNNNDPADDFPTTPNSQESPEFLGPDRVVAVTPKRLFIADDGYYFTDLDEIKRPEGSQPYRHPKVGNLDRIVTVNLDYSISTLFQNTDVEFTQSAYIDSVSCGTGDDWVIID